MSVVASPTQQGVIKSSTAAHLRTNILNGHVKVASSTNSTGGQSAVYSIVGGSITNNVQVVLPNLTGDDTIATQGDNINWTGNHTFQQGLNSIGPITTPSSITAGAVSSTTLTTTGDLSAIGNLNANGDLTLFGVINPLSTGLTTTTGGNHSVGVNLSVGGNSTVAGSHTVTGPLTANGTGHVGGTMTMVGAATAQSSLTVQGTHIITSTGNLSHAGSEASFIPSSASFGTAGHIYAINQTGGVDADYFGVQFGSSKGLVLGTDSSQKLGFHFVVPVVAGSSHGNVTAPSTYTTGVQGMINDVYGGMRANGLLV